MIDYLVVDWEGQVSSDHRIRKIGVCRKGRLITIVDREAFQRDWRSMVILNCGVRTCSSLNFL
jgi:hypothetical protein